MVVGVELTNNIGSEVYHSLNKSKKKKLVKRLLLGDSVAKQLYDNDVYNDSIYSLTCNQVISAAGYYFLLNNFITTNKEQLPEEVILLCNPRSLGNQLDAKAFNYFLKPLYKKEYTGLMNKPLKERIKQIPFYWASQIPLIKASCFTPTYESLPRDYGLFSPIAQTYLDSIAELCKTNDIRFRLEPVPMKKSSYKEMLDLKQHIKYMPQMDAAILTHFFDQYTFLEDSLFLDHSHFYKEHIPQDYLKLINFTQSEL
ncbi:hypothetical protein AGMMS49525_06750 [Bacteroidia bacterium]|nr:hypothetical protein AGMMS49525_06750 [Bacteroidia bacterium]